MTWILAFTLPIVTGLVHLLVSGGTDKTLASGSRLVLRYLCGGFFGIWLMTAGSFHVLASDSVAEYIGWAPGSPFQVELGFASIGIGLMSLRLALVRNGDLLAAWSGAGAFLLGCAWVHWQDIVANQNFSAGNAGPVFYVDILAPVVAATLWWLGRRSPGGYGPANSIVTPGRAL